MLVSFDSGEILAITLLFFVPILLFVLYLSKKRREVEQEQEDKKNDQADQI